jgi:hypothetical protein
MTPPELPIQLPQPIEEQQVIAQQANIEPPLKAAMILMNLGIRKYAHLLIKL